MAPSAEQNSLATAKILLSAAGSFAATAMVVRSVAKDFLPRELRDYIFSGIRSFFTRFLNHFTLVIDQFDGLVSNELYEAAVIYLCPKVSPRTRRLKISKPVNENHYNITMEGGEELVDVYNGEIFKWVWICKKSESRNVQKHSQMTEIRSFELTFHKRNRELVINSYLPYITKEAQIMKQEKRTVKIFTIDYPRVYDLANMWKPVNLDHPATFETLAMDSDQKDMILNDLDRFIERRDYYRKVGKAWKRGYLLYGPPGTGKSSLIAAIANYLKFDIYDLELTTLKQNSDLRRLLVGTANKSILVVEDIDCTIDLQDQLANRSTAAHYPPGSHPPQDKSRIKVTLSGLLNFVDGLWSSCGDERIIIFTTNNIEKLDPALLRPGRMDLHINLSYCTLCGFKLLASNYLGIKDHVLLEEIEGLIQIAKVTPAEVAEQLLKNDDPDVSLQGLIGFMHKKIKENEEAEAAEKLKKAEAATEKLKAESADKSDEESQKKLARSRKP